MIESYSNYQNYLERLSELMDQYDITVEALDRFNDDDFGKKSFIEERVKRIPTIPPRIDFNEYKEEFKKLNEFVGKKLPPALKKQYNALKQNVLIICFAFFEAFIKDLFRDILLDDLYTLKPGRKPKDKRKMILEPKAKKIILDCLKKFGLDKTIDEQVENEVKEMSKNFKEWPGYFEKRTGISWFKNEKWAENEQWNNLVKLKDLRNDIIHEYPDKEVSDEDLIEALKLFHEIPNGLIEHVFNKYPDKFDDLIDQVGS
jgi:hypothetical protein